MEYGIFSQQRFSEDNGRYIGWGIEGRSEDGSVTERIEDLSDDESFARAVAAVLNREKVEYVHLIDVLENFLAAPEELE